MGSIRPLSIPEPKVEHHEGRGIRSCPIFPELRPILDEAFEIFGDKSEYVVAAPQYRAAANTAMGWKNANLRSEMTRLLRRAGVSGWPRLFHSMRASRQIKFQREFPLHVVCSWLGNSPRIAQQSYLLVTEDDFARAAGAKKMMVEGVSSESVFILRCYGHLRYNFGSLESAFDQATEKGNNQRCHVRSQCFY